MTNEITIDIESLRDVPDNSIVDPDTLRQIGLYTTKFENLKKDTTWLHRKVKKGFEFGCLYPHIFTSEGIKDAAAKLNLTPEQKEKIKLATKIRYNK